MKKILTNICSMVLLLFLLVNILTKSNIVNISINIAFNIWKENLFPYLFPLFVVSEILVSFGFVEIIGSCGKKIVQKLFKSKSEASYVFVMSLITGFPSSAKYISQLYESGNLNDKEATKILMFTHFSNPLFIIGTIASTFLGNPALAILIFISHYLSNIVIGVLFRNYHATKKEKNNSSFSSIFQSMISKPRKKLGTILGTAIINSINTLLLILGSVSIFLVITSILNSMIDFGPLGNAIINGIIEMSQGLKYVSLLDITTRLKTTISVMIISFGGLSVHLQVMSILSDTKIKYFPFFISRILHALIAGILAYFLFPILTF